MALKTGKKMRMVKGDWNVNGTINDHRDDPEQVAEAISKLLAEHGLEIINHPTDGDWYTFSVAKLK